MRKNIVAGNWKMNKTLQEGIALAKELNEALANEKPNCDVIICTPFIHLASVTPLVDAAKIGVGAENCADKESGAYTGEVSAAMVASTGAKYVILGHSERRAYYGETVAILEEKVKLALANGLTPIFCIGEVLEEDEISRTGTIDDIWSRILFEDDNGEEQVGYIPTSVLEGYEDKNQVASDATSDGTVEAGIIHKSTGEGVFAEAVEGVTQTGGNAGVLEGQPIMVSADSSLRPLGVFHITHYCQCSICCGPWANGITSTGVTATTNRTIAVDPTVIPYGSKVVINGQVYVAEDCGGAIKNNRIDIYMGSHAEALNSGVFDVEVYLLEEGSSVQGIEGIQEGNQE